MSVGIKLAGATIALVAVVAAVGYLGLSAYQRENLLHAKETAAVAVTRFFADSCAAPVIFGDDKGINDALTSLGRNEDVTYAAVWSVDATEGIGERLAELSRGASAELSSVPTRLELRRETDRLVLLAPVLDPETKLVGEVVVTFSLSRENAAIVDVRWRMLLLFAAVAVGITALLQAIARMAIVRPLRKLVLAANRIERGGSSDIDVRSHDEIGQLSSAFRSMARAIGTREERISARNRDMRLLLDNVDQGFLSLDANAQVSEERSWVVDQWFGAPGRAMPFWEYVQRVDPKVAEWFQVGWEAIKDDILPLEVCLSQLPRFLNLEDRTLELAYRPILQEGQLGKVLVVITNVTARIKRESAEMAERDMLSIFRHMLSDRTAFEEFFDEAGVLVESIRRFEGSNLNTLKRNIHTLKGTCAVYGIDSVARLCHELESDLEAGGDEITAERKLGLAAAWSHISHVRAQFSLDGGIAVERDEYRSLLDELRARIGYDPLTARLASWQFEPASKRLSLIGDQIRQLAGRLQKGDVQIHLEPTKLRLPPKKWAAFWAVFVHVLRNAVDHGIETQEERAAAGKPAQPTISLSLVCEGREVVLSIKDDGRGIDWKKIAERAGILGISHDTAAELEDALFEQSVTSRTEVTVMSGRGVGLSAVREVVHQMGGRIVVQSESGAGTTFSFYLPATLLADDAGPSPRPSASPPALEERTRAVAPRN
jgi:two-component system chemotaxis sensor kinase CheA